MLHYLAAEPSDVTYAAIIEGADDQIIKAIRGVGRAFIQGSLGDLSPVESLALGRYRKSIEGFADYANSMECTRKALLKPRKARRRVPGSAEYVPMLLTLALARGGLETYVDDADGSDVSSLNSGDFEDSHDSSNDESRHSSAGEDSGDSNNDDNRHSSASEDGSTEQSNQSDEDSEEDGLDVQEGSDEEVEAESEEGASEGTMKRAKLTQRRARRAKMRSPRRTRDEESEDEESDEDAEASEEGDDEETEARVRGERRCGVR